MGLVQLINGVALGSLLMIVSSGLAMIYGLRGVTNFAHGALYMAGAYLAYTVTNALTYWAALVIVPLGLAAIGAVLEIALFRRLQKRSAIVVGLITFGLALILERVIVLIWGEQTLSVNPPPLLDGSVPLGDSGYPAYRVFLIVVAVLLAVGLVLWLRRSRIGLHIRAASRDLETASVLGVNVDRVSLVVVCLGSGLAGLAGVLAAPYLSLTPDMGATILITVLIVVVIGGAGSVGGAMIAGMGLGVVQTLGMLLSPTIAVLIPYAALVAVLLLRPKGLAGTRPL